MCVFGYFLLVLFPWRTLTHPGRYVTKAGSIRVKRRPFSGNAGYSHSLSLNGGLGTAAMCRLWTQIPRPNAGTTTSPPMGLLLHFLICKVGL